MTHNELFYWLQGHFEMASYDANALATLTNTQVDCAFRLPKQVFVTYAAFLAAITEAQRAAILDVLECCVVNVTDDLEAGEEQPADFPFIVDLARATKAIIKTHG